MKKGERVYKGEDTGRGKVDRSDHRKTDIAYNYNWRWLFHALFELNDLFT